MQSSRTAPQDPTTTDMQAPPHMAALRMEGLKRAWFLGQGTQIQTIQKRPIGPMSEPSGPSTPEVMRSKPSLQKGK